MLKKKTKYPLYIEIIILILIYIITYLIITKIYEFTDVNSFQDFINFWLNNKFQVSDTSILDETILKNSDISTNISKDTQNNKLDINAQESNTKLQINLKTTFIVICGITVTTIIIYCVGK